MKAQDNLRDGVPFSYTEKDGAEFIDAMLNADPHNAFAITVDGNVAGSIGEFLPVTPLPKPRKKRK